MKFRKKTILILIAVGALTGAGTILGLTGFFRGGSGIPSDTMTRGLVGYWSFDEGSGTTTFDASNNGNNGTFLTQDSSPRWSSGKAGGALNFDGKDDYVRVADSASLAVNSALTIETWVNFDSFPSTFVIIDNNDYGLYGDSINFYFFLESSINSIAISNFTIGRWYHIVGAWDGLVAKMYIDGAEEDSDAKTGSLSDDGSNLYIGTDSPSGNQYYFNGKIDEVRIYNRALSAEEVRYHYNRGGPIAHWKLDEGSGSTAYDSTDNNNDGTIYGGTATSTSEASGWKSGKYGSALAFDGVDDYISVADDDSLSFNAGNQFALEAWIKPDSVSGNPTIIGKGVGGGSEEYVFQFDGSSHLRAWLRDSGGTQSNTCDGVTVLNTNVWHHIVVIWNNTDIRAYLNGLEECNVSASGGIQAGSNDLWIGAREYPAGTVYEPFDGIIDDVRIYNYVRTPEEIALDYNAGFAARFGYTEASCSVDPASCMDKGLAGYWNFEEGQGTTTYDSSDSQNNGTFLTAASSPRWTNGIKPLSGGISGGGALSFDGKDDYVDAGNDSSLQITDNISLEAWVKLNVLASSQNDLWSSVVAKAENYHLYTQKSDNTVRFKITTSEAITASIDGSSLGTSWGHLVGTYDGKNLKIYLNGILKDTQAQTGSIATSSNSLTLGDQPDFAHGLNGFIDDVRIYNRALLVEEVRYHYNRGGPITYWKFDEGSGATVYDESNNGNNGTVYGGAATSTAENSGWKSGKYGSALAFDGVNDYVQATVSQSTTTVSFWMQNQGGSWQYITNSNGTYYVNGIRTSTAPSPYPIYFTGTTVQIGKTGAAAYFNGLIDDVRIYNYARTATQIQQDYNEGAAARFGQTGGDATSIKCSNDPASCMDKGLAGYWNFEEGQGTTTYDSSDSQNNGTFLTAASSPRWTNGIKPLSGGISGGGALSFDGKDDYVQTTVSQGTTTVEFWRQSSGGSWQHVVNSNGAYYVNGVSTTTTPSPYPIYFTGTILQIGKTGASSYFSGLADDVRIYNRALSAEEVRYHYNREGPIAHWKFDEGQGETVYDESSNDSDGTLYGGMATSTLEASGWKQGKYGSALSFDGVNDYVGIANFEMPDNITLEAWIKTNQKDANIRSVMRADAGSHFSLYRWNDGKVAFYSGDTLESTTVLQSEQWYYVVGTYNGTIKKIYINGVLENSAAVSVSGGTAELRIGGDNYSQWFSGFIDDVRIYNYARTQEQIRQDYNSGFSTYFR